VTTPDALRTERLVLRRWRDEDRGPYAALNADPEVMERLPAPLNREESDAMIERIEASFEERGFGLWAVEVIDGPPCIGFVGLNVPASTRTSRRRSRSGGVSRAPPGVTAMPPRAPAPRSPTASHASSSTRSSRSPPPRTRALAR